MTKSLNGEIRIEPWSLINVQWCLLVPCLQYIWLNALIKEKCLTSMIPWNPHVCTSYAYHMFWWNASINVLWIMMLVICSSKLCLVSFLPSSPGVLVPKTLVVCLEVCHFFMILSVNLWILRIQTVLWLRKSPWSHELSQLSDISSISSVNKIQ